MSKSIIDAVRSRILSKGRGWCFTPGHFRDLKSPTGVRTALVRLEAESVIRRLGHGIYEYPRVHPVLGTLPPQIDQVVKAIAEKNGIRVVPSGAHAANLIGFSEQVPAKNIFLTNGLSKKIKIGKMEIIFRTTTEKNLYATGKVGIAIQALKNFGKNHIDQITRNRLKRFLNGTTQQELIKNLKYAPQWIQGIMFEVMGVK